MRTETALKRRDDLKAALRNVYSLAKHFGHCSDQMNARKLDTLGHSHYARVPGWVRWFVDGYWQALIDRAYESDLVFGGFFEGKFYSTHSNRADYYGNNGIEPSDYADDGRVTARGHYWKAHVDAGIPRAFFISKL